MKNVLEYSSAKGSEMVNLLFPENHTLFTNPKNLDMIKLFIQSSSKSNSIILDFFSGSATTAHAVMQLNAEDGGTRKYIMVHRQQKHQKTVKQEKRDTAQYVKSVKKEYAEQGKR